MDRRSIAALGAGVAVIVGVALGTGDDVKNEDGSAPVVVGVAVANNKLIKADGTAVEILQDHTSAAYLDHPVLGPVVRVPSMAGAIIVSTTDYTPEDVARQLALEPDKTTYRDLFVAAGVAIPPTPVD